MEDINKSRYKKLISFAKSRKIMPAYVEMHHILPRNAGGTNDPSNLVALTAREHFLAHWLLYRIQKTPASAKAFKLMVQSQKRRRGRDYEAAKKQMSEDMFGERNVSKRDDVRKKLRENYYSHFAGKKRPEHSALMKSRGVFQKEKNPFFGKGDLQRGGKNHMARKVMGLHIFYGVACWQTATDAAKSLGVSVQAVVQAIKLQGRSKGWRLVEASWQ